MAKTIHPKLFFTTVIGNVIEHYDKVLFGLVAPFIAPLFFPKSDPLVALILIYFPFGLVTIPLGALYWGHKGDQIGRKKVLYYSLMGMSMTLILTSFLPTYEQAGLLGPFLLHFTRGLTSFFSAGEGPGASLILIENAPCKTKELTSSYYEMSSVLGTLIASLFITWLSFQGQVLTYWRILFLMSGLISFLGFWMRRKIFLKTEIVSSLAPILSWKQMRQKFLLPFLAVVFLTGFSCSNYIIAMKMFNAYLPLVTPILPHELLAMHSQLLFFDFLLLAFFGWVSTKIDKKILIPTSLFIFLILLYPLFRSLQNPSLFNIFFLRMALVGLGCAIAAPFNAWAIDLLPPPYRFRLLALSRAIGAQVIGGSAISVSLWSVKQTGWVGAPCFYLLFTTFFSLFFIGLYETVKINEKKGFKKII